MSSRGPAPLGGAPREPGAALANDDPALPHGWYPVAYVHDLVGPTTVQLLGDRYTVTPADDGRAVTVDPPPWGAQVMTGLVWLAPQRPVAELLPVPEFDDPSYGRIALDVATSRAAAGLMADNFLDLAHFPFVHASTFGTEEDPSVPAYDVLPTEHGFSYSYTHAYLNSEDPGVPRGDRQLLQHRDVAYDYLPPFQLVLRIRHIEAGGHTVIVYPLQPETVDSTRAYTWILRDEMGGSPPDLESMRTFEQRILDEDVVLQDKFEIDALPLDLRSELHVKADAAGIAFRRCLASFRAAAASFLEPVTR